MLVMMFNLAITGTNRISKHSHFYWPELNLCPRTLVNTNIDQQLVFQITDNEVTFALLVNLHMPKGCFYGHALCAILGLSTCDIIDDFPICFEYLFSDI